LVVRGVEGGLDAGRRLRNGIQEYIRTLPTYHADDRIVIHIYANMRGLSKACRQANIIREEERMSEFVAGLGASHPLTSFTDAGGVKEAADAKMRGRIYSLTLRAMTDPKQPRWNCSIGTSIASTSFLVELTMAMPGF
jgi:hypothetical protein